MMEKSQLSQAEEFQIFYVETQPLSFKSRLCIGIPPQKSTKLKARGKKRVTWQQRKPTHTAWSQVIKMNRHKRCVMLIVHILVLMCWEWHFASVIFFPTKHNSSLTKRKTSGKSELRSVLQKTWSIFFKTVKVIKTRKVWEITSA